MTLSNDHSVGTKAHIQEKMGHCSLISVGITEFPYGNVASRKRYEHATLCERLCNPHKQKPPPHKGVFLLGDLRKVF